MRQKSPLYGWGLALVAFAVFALFALFTGEAYGATVREVSASVSTSGVQALWTTDENYDAPEGAVVVKITGSVEPHSSWPEGTSSAGTVQDGGVVFPEWKLQGATTITVQGGWLQRFKTYRKKEFQWYDLKGVIALVDFATDGLPGSKHHTSSEDKQTSLELMGRERGIVVLTQDHWVLPFNVDAYGPPLQEGTFYLVVAPATPEEPTPPFEGDGLGTPPLVGWTPPDPFGDWRPVVAAYLTGRIQGGKLFSADQEVYLKPLRQEISSFWVSEGICNRSVNGDWDVNPASMTTNKALRITAGRYQLGYQPLSGEESLPIAIGIGISTRHALVVDPGDQAPLIYLNQEADDADITEWFVVTWRNGHWTWREVR